MWIVPKRYDLVPLYLGQCPVPGSRPSICSDVLPWMRTPGPGYCFRPTSYEPTTLNGEKILLLFGKILDHIIKMIKDTLQKMIESMYIEKYAYLCIINLK